MSITYVNFDVAIHGLDIVAPDGIEQLRADVQSAVEAVIAPMSLPFGEVVVETSESAGQANPAPDTRVDISKIAMLPGEAFVNQIMALGSDRALKLSVSELSFLLGLATGKLSSALRRLRD